MKRIIIAALLSVSVAVPAVAADGKNSVGINYGLDMNGVIGIQGEFDISSSMPNKAPVAVQVFWKNYWQSYATNVGTYQYSYNGFGAAAIYDFGAVGKLDKKIRPYAGLGLITLNARLSGPKLQQLWRADHRGKLKLLVGVSDWARMNFQVRLPQCQQSRTCSGFVAR